MPPNRQSSMPNRLAARYSRHSSSPTPSRLPSLTPQSKDVLASLGTPTPYGISTFLPSPTPPQYSSIEIPTLIRVTEGMPEQPLQAYLHDIQRDMGNLSTFVHPDKCLPMA